MYVKHQNPLHKRNREADQGTLGVVTSRLTSERLATHIAY